MSQQAEISHELLQEKIGQRQTVLVDAVEGGASYARSQADAPEIDGQVIIPDTTLTVGKFAEVEIVNADHYDLFASTVEK